MVRPPEATEYHICENCRIVSKDPGFLHENHICDRCGSSEGFFPGYFPFPGPAEILDLMGYFYRLELEPRDPTDPFLRDVPPNSRFVIAVLFITLGEYLLDKFLLYRMSLMDISQDVQERLLNDNLWMNERVGRLFKSLVGVSWNEAIAQVSSGATEDYKAAVKFYMNVRGERNDFLHKAYLWKLNDEIVERCRSEVGPLIRLFIALHNQYNIVAQEDL